MMLSKVLAQLWVGVDETSVSFDKVMKGFTQLSGDSTRLEQRRFSKDVQTILGLGAIFRRHIL